MLALAHIQGAEEHLINQAHRWQAATVPANVPNPLQVSSCARGLKQTGRAIS
jgi:hypothetical protein